MAGRRGQTPSKTVKANKMHQNKGCWRSTGAGGSSSKVSISGRKEADINDKTDMSNDIGSWRKKGA